MEPTQHGALTHACSLAVLTHLNLSHNPSIGPDEPEWRQMHHMVLSEAARTVIDMAKVTNTPDVLVGFDTETSGLSDDAQIVTASVVTLNKEGETLESKSWLLQPIVEFDPGAVEVHGVTEAHATRNGQDHKQGVIEIADYLAEQNAQGNYLVAYNAAYDFTRISVELNRYRKPVPEFTHILDPMVLDKEYRRYAKGRRRLVDVSEVYGCPLSDDDAHDALADAVAAVNVMFKMFERIEGTNPEALRAQKEWNTAKIQDALMLDYSTPEGAAEIIRLQQEYYKRQRISMEQYLRRVKNDESIELNTQWPIEPLPGINI